MSVTSNVGEMFHWSWIREQECGESTWQNKAVMWHFSSCHRKAKLKLDWKFTTWIKQKRGLI